MPSSLSFSFKASATALQGSIAIDSEQNAYVGTAEGVVIKVDSSGAEQWRYDAGSPIGVGARYEAGPPSCGVP